MVLLLLFLSMLAATGYPVAAFLWNLFMRSVEDLIRLHEGLRLKPYQCSAGKMTIGYGHNLQDNGVTLQQAESLLRDDVDVVVSELGFHVPYFSELGEVRQAVLIDMCFNLGWPRLSGFKKFLGALDHDDCRLAAVEMLDSRWAVQVGARAQRLADMMRSGEWSDA